MSLLTIGGGPRGPSRQPTHKPLDHQKLLRLGAAVEERADGEPISCDAIDELALDEGVDASHLYAATAMATEVELSREHPVVFVACAGKCQSWGALDRIERLVQLRQERIEAGKPAFDIQARNCLDKCDHAPVVMAHSPDGTVVLTQATEDKLAEAVAELCG